VKLVFAIIVHSPATLGIVGETSSLPEPPEPHLTVRSIPINMITFVNGLIVTSSYIMMFVLKKTLNTTIEPRALAVLWKKRSSQEPRIKSPVIFFLR
jgi:hypothetical protein